MTRRLLLIENNSSFLSKIQGVLSKYFPSWKISTLISNPAEFESEIDSTSKFDLILCGIHSKDGQCFSILEKKGLKTPVIFFAERAEFAIRAFDFNCIDFILKPIQEERLIKAFEKFETWNRLMKSRQNETEGLETKHEIPLKKAYKKRFLIKSGTRLSFVSVEDVACFIAEEGITFLVASGSSQRYMVNHSLNELESGLLDPEKFYRINRSVIINLDNLIEMKPYHNGRLALSLTAKTEEAIVVARERVNEFKSWINQ